MKFISQVSQQLTGWFNNESDPASKQGGLEVQLQSLEERVLYSAAPVPLDLVSEPTVDANFEQIEQQLDFLNDAVEQLQSEAVDDSQLRLDEDEYSIDEFASHGDSTNGLRELVILDKGVEGWEALYEDVVANNTSGEVTVRLIDTNVDGVEAITEILADSARNGAAWSALHIVSHGDNGEVHLGDAVLDSDSIAGYSHEISQWQDALAFDADILIYGCDLAADESGESLVDTISALSGANVAASDDLTGNSSLGGDWDLEFVAGTIDSELVFTASAIESWDGLLNTVASPGPVVVPLNEAPISIDSSQSGLENSGVRFEPVDFGFNDPDGDILKSIRIESLPTVGNLTLSGNAILQADIDATANGLVVDSANILQLRYVGLPDVHGENVASFNFSVSDGQDWSATPAKMDLSLAPEDRLWISTEGDVSTKTSIPGNGSGAIQFGGPDLEFGQNTAGYWSKQFFPAGINIDAVHYVDNAIQLGAANLFILNRGDILFSAGPAADNGGSGPLGPVAAVEIATVVDDSYSPLPIHQGDIVRFRPTSSDYSTGTYEVVARTESLHASVPTDFNLNAFALIEEDAVVGDRLVHAGDFLISDSLNPNDIRLLELNVPGVSSEGSLITLIEGADIGVDGVLTGLDLIEATTTAGGQVLGPSSILAAVDVAEKVGDNDLAVEAQDIFRLDVASTSYSGNDAVAKASMFLDGSDVGGNPEDPESGIDALSLLGSPDVLQPVLDPQPENVAIQENEARRFAPSDFVSDLTVNSLSSVVITKLPDAANGSLTFRGVAVIEGQVIPADELEFLVFVPVLDHSFASDFIEYRAASDSEVFAPHQISLEVSPVADDVLIGSGAEFHTFFPTDQEVVSPDGFDRIDPHIASLADGGYVIAWHVESSESAIQLQRYDADHNKVGGLIDFTDDVPGTRSFPSVASLADGGFVAMATRQAADGSDNHVFVTRYDSSGNKVLLESTADGVRGNRLTFEGSGQQRDGDIVGLNGGGFAVAVVDYESSQTAIKVKVFDDGAFLNETILISLPGGEVSDVDLAPTKQGGFVATWKFSTVIGESIHVRFHDLNGFPVGSVATFANSGPVEGAPSIDVLKNNDAVVVWGKGTAGDSLGDHALAGAIVASDGTVVSSGSVYVDHGSAAFDPDVVALNDGGFLIASSDADADSSTQSITAHRFDSQFTAVGDPEVINSDTTGAQTSPSLALLGSNEIAAVWNTEEVGGAIDVVSNAVQLSSSAAAGQRIPLDLTVVPQAGVDEILNNIELTDLPADAKIFAKDTATGNEVEVFGPDFNLNSVDIDTVELLLPLGVTESEMLLTVTASDGGDIETTTHRLHAKTTQLGNKTISGTVFNDENADGLVHDATGFEGVAVHIYHEVGGVFTEAFPSVTTDADGYYEFNGLGEGTYYVAVDSTSIGIDGRAWAEQTYGGDGSIKGALSNQSQSAGFMFGGRFGSRSDDVSTLTSSEHVNRQVLSISDSEASKVDFGFSFNVVVNEVDQFDPLNHEARTAQGSFRQFMQNANHISGDNHMKFVPVVAPSGTASVDGISGTSRWWSINVVDELPNILSSGTTVDGQAWRPTAGGLVERDLNDFTVVNSFTGTVGANDVAFAETDAPELELVGMSAIGSGVQVVADPMGPGLSDIEISNLAIHGFGSGQYSAAIHISGENTDGSLLTGVSILNNVIGSGPNDIVAEADSRTAEDYKGIFIAGASDGLIANNVIAGNTSSGVRLDGFFDVYDWTIEDNHISSNAANNTYADGIDGTNSHTIVVRRNAIHDNAGMGVDDHSTGDHSYGWIIEDNSIYNNGFGTDLEGSGIRLTGDGSVVRANYIANNENDGVTVSGYRDSSLNVIVPGAQNLITQNRFESNGQIAIDLMSDAFNGETFAFYDTGPNDGLISFSEATGPLANVFYAIANGITNDDMIDSAEHAAYLSAIVNQGGGENLLDVGPNANQSNAGIDAPVVVNASFDFNDFNVQVAISNPDVAEVELYTIMPGDTDANPEAWQYFKTVPVSSMTYIDTVTLTNPATSIPAERYAFTLPASDFPADVPRDTPIVALGVDSLSNTSEVGQSFTPTFVNHAPVAGDSTVSTMEEQPHVFSMSDFDSSDPDLDDITELIVTTLPTNGQLGLGGSPVVTGQRISADQVGNLVFEPDANFSGVATFNFAVGDGSLDSAPATMNIQVDSVADAPIALDGVFTVDEDGVFDNFTEATLGFADPDDFGADSMTGVIIESFTGNGTLTTSTGDATGRTLSVAELAELEYRPALDENGTAIAQVQFRVVDSGVGDNVSDVHTITFDVTPVSDNPTGVSQTVTIEEDELVTFDATSFGFLDAADGDDFAGVRIVGFTGSGSLTIDGGGVPSGSFISAVDLPRLQFQPGANDTGFAISTIEFQVVDDSLSNNEDLIVRQINYNVTPLSDNPVGQDDTISIAEDSILTFTESTFGFSDPFDNPDDTFNGVQIVSFTGSGTLQLNGTGVAANEIVAATDLAGLEYLPAADENGMAIATIHFRVIDSGEAGSNIDDVDRELTINVTPVSDAPEGVSSSVSVVEDEVLYFNESTFGFSDPIDGAFGPSDNFAGVRIVDFSGSGTLTLNGVAVTNGQEVTNVDLPNLEYLPDANQNGSGLAAIQFRVIDDGATNDEDLLNRLLTIDVTPASDAPVGQSGRATVAEDSILNFDETTFGFSDPIDNPQDSFAGVRVVSFGGSGSLTLNGIDVTPGQTITAAQLPQLEYLAAPDDNGVGIASIQFEVIDEGAVGSNVDTTVRELLIDVTPVSDNPAGVTQTVAIDEDQTFTFTPTSFGFNDAADGDAFAGVRVTGFSGGGTLELNGSAVMPGQLVNASDLPNLVYQPPANAYGVGLATIDFRVVDNAATNNEDINVQTLTFDVSPIHDAPTGVSDTVTVVEDGVLNFTQSSFGYSDAIDNETDSFEGVRIEAFSGNGTLTLNGTPVAAGSIVSVTDLPNLEYRPVADSFGVAEASIDFRVIDSGTINNEDLTIRMLTIDVAPESDNPIGQDATVTIDEDSILTFDETTFGFSDPSDNDSFSGVRIVSFGGSGTLTLNGAPVVTPQLISAANLPGLEYQPATDDNGNGLATIQFQVRDNGTAGSRFDQFVRDLVVNVTPVSDNPTGVTDTVTIDEDQFVTFTPASFGFADAADGDSFAAVRIVAFNGSGALTLGGAAVAPNEVISATDLSMLEYRPGANENGNGLSTIAFRVIDSGTTNNEDLTIRSLTYDVNPVSDAPVGEDRTVTINEDSILEFDETTFGFSDPDDFEADSFAGVQIVAFAGRGALTLNGAVVGTNQIIAAGDLANLEYQPVANDHGNAVASIQFRVIDDGSPGAQTDTTVRELTINVDPTWDAPTGDSTTVSILEDSIYGFDSSSFGFSDTDGDTFVGVRVVDFNGSGTLTLNGIDVAPGDVVAVAELAGLEYRPGANENGAGLATVTFRVIDDSSTNNEDLVDRVITFDVMSQDDHPTGQSNTFSILEDEAVTFSPRSFGYDAVDGTAMEGVRIVSFSGSGSLTLDGADVVAGTIVNVADLSRMTFQPAQDDFGPGLSQIEFRVVDVSRNNNEDLTTRTLTYDVVEVNDAPVGMSSTISTNEDQPLGFTPSDFGFSDTVDRGRYRFEAVRIMDFMGRGTLQFNGAEVVPGQVILVNELASLVYQPEGNDNGFGISTIQFRVIDDGDGFNEDTTTRTLTIDVESKDDAPTGQSTTVTMNENDSFALTQSIFGFDDASDLVPNSFDSVRIVNVNGSGTLTLDGAPVSPNTVIDVADISNLEFTPTTDQWGDGLASIEFRVIDDGSNGPGEANEDLTSRVLTFDVLEVNDSPEIEADAFTIRENTIVSHQLSVSDPNGDDFRLSLVGSGNDNSQFQIGPDGQSIQFASAPDFENPTSINGGNTYFVDVEAIDVHGASSIQRIEVRVLNVNESIRLVDDVDLLVVGGSSIDSVLDNDNNGRTLPSSAIFEVLSQPGSGTVTFNDDGTFEFAQGSGTLESEVEFTYTVENGGEVTEAKATFKQGGGQAAGGDGGSSDDGGGSGEDSSNETEESSGDSGDDDLRDSIDKNAIDSSLVNDRTDPANLGENGGSGTNFIPNNGGSGVNTANTDINDVQFSVDASITKATSLYTSYAYAKFVDTSLLLSTELASRALVGAKAGLQEFTEDFAFAAAFWQELDSASENFVQTDVGEIEAAIVAGSLVTSVAVGVLARTALLVGSFGATYVNPWWTTFDFLPLIADEEGESIEQIVDNDGDKS